MTDKREFSEDYLDGAIEVEGYKPGKHHHAGMGGLTGWDHPSEIEGEHRHPSPDGWSTSAKDEPGHQHKLPSKFWTGERRTT